MKPRRSGQPEKDAIIERPYLAAEQPPAGPPAPFLGWIGQGAAGDDPEVPECPVCRAADGGGHGGGCPNTDKNPADWVTDPPPGWIAPGR